ncbi:MAG: hypothetical protein RLY86_683 [Pseudomonadota bacterium]|jgi:chromosome segregation ATPase
MLAWIEKIGPLLGLLGLVGPLFLWLFAPRLARHEDVAVAVQAEREERERRIGQLETNQAAITARLAELHRDHEVLQERLRHMPTQDGLNAVVNRLERLTGVLEAELGGLHRLRDAVARHDDIIADAARASAAERIIR